VASFIVQNPPVHSRIHQWNFRL